MLCWGCFGKPLSFSWPGTFSHCHKGSEQEVISLPRSCQVGISDVTQWLSVLHPASLGTEDRGMFLHLDNHS